MVKQGVDTVVKLSWFVCLTVSMVTTSKAVSLEKMLLSDLGRLTNSFLFSGDRIEAQKADCQERQDNLRHFCKVIPFCNGQYIYT